MARLSASQALVSGQVARLAAGWPYLGPWHLVLFILTPFFPMGNLLIFVPLFVGTIVAASYFCYLRLCTGSVWPASIGHSVHNAAGIS